jgi:dTDP-4-amino-4,6-dideoxygalactose transaminase
MIATKTIPLMMPYVPPGAIDAVAATLRTRWIGQGPRVEEFEREFSRRIVSGRTSVAVSSCTAALHLAYILTGIGPGDSVIAPLFTCTATNIPLLHCGAKIQFCDVAPGSLNMDVEHARSLITEKTKAIVVVHYGGEPVDDGLFQLGLPVIEDCAQAIGRKWVGQRGTYACFSFQAVKHITTCDGGMLVLPAEQKAEAKRRRWFGIDREAKLQGIWENDIREVGYKYQMTDVAAAMGLAGLDALDAQMMQRRTLRDAYLYGLTGVEGIRLLDADQESACWLCTVTVDRREDFRRKLKAEGIESDQVHYRNDRYSIFKAFPGTFQNMDAIDSKYLVLPLHMGMDVSDVELICEVIRSGW